MLGFAPVPKEQGPRIAVTMAALVILTALALMLFLRFGGNVTGFFRIGGQLPLSPFLAASEALVQPGEPGYDGQFFLTLAYDPLLRHEGTLAALDNPRYRARRIFLPALAHGIALGSPRLVPWALVFLNAASAVGLVALLAFGWLRETPYRALGVLAFQGLWVGLALSTADLLALVFLVVALTCHRSGKARGVASCLLLATLSRETYLLHAVVFAGLALWEHRRKDALWIAAGQVPALAWNAWVLLRVPQGDSAVRESFGLPFCGIFEAFLPLVRGGLTGKLLYEGLSLALLLGVGVMLAGAFSRKADAIAWCAVPFLALLVFSRTTVLGYFVNYTRVFLGLYVLLLLAGEGGAGYRRLRGVLLGTSAAAAALYLGRQLFF